MRVLVVEDDPEMASILCDLLAEEGISSSTAVNGAAALELVNAKPPPDVVILDLLLPEIGGLDVGKTMRETPALSAIPIILISAFREEVEDAGLTLGTPYAMEKPFELDQLLDYLEEITRNPAA